MANCRPALWAGSPQGGAGSVSYKRVWTQESMNDDKRTHRNPWYHFWIFYISTCIQALQEHSFIYLDVEVTWHFYPLQHIVHDRLKGRTSVSGCAITTELPSLPIRAVTADKKWQIWTWKEHNMSSWCAWKQTVWLPFPQSLILQTHEDIKNKLQQLGSYDNRANEGLLDKSSTWS